MSLDHLRLAAEIIGLLSIVGGIAFAVIKTIRELKDGIKCLLRAEMMNIYYKHRDKDEMREYEAQNFEMMYTAYKHLGGNSFIDNIHAEVGHWEVLP